MNSACGAHLVTLAQNLFYFGQSATPSVVTFVQFFPFKKPAVIKEDTA